MNNRYGSLAAWVYHLDKPIGRSFGNSARSIGDIEFYREGLKGCRGPILEPAVGNGRVLIPLLEAGHDMHGFDASPEMLDHCRRECAMRGFAPVLDLMRFEDFEAKAAFDAIILPAGSFQLIVDAAVARDVLRRFREALTPSGRLIVDLDPVSAFCSTADRQRSWRAGEDLLTLQERRLETDAAGQTTVSLLTYEHRRHGRLILAEEELFSLRWWGIAEFEEALGVAGFADPIVSADYRRGVAPSRDSGSITFEARVDRVSL
ncbi:class I SAM-dependent methyltransferase [Reyranella massiliensis]|uniref:class I SAM-dependent methyltransferase n=1 Tax=Reyranella massiliensis TaxID=445220 RepID=UPI000312F2D1|nr:class I SAM-dependent methyltransferase [Reyranella massiliensis]